MDHGQAHGGSHLIAVAIQLIEGLEAAGFEVGRHAIDHLVEVARGDTVAGHGIVKRGQHGMRAATAGQCVVEGRAPLLDGARMRAGLVAQIVAIAHEGIHGAYGIALLAGKQHEGIVEIACTGARHAAAISIGIFERGHHAARERATRAREPSSSQTRSTLEMAGRRESTSKSCAAILSRTRMPPRLNKSISKARRRSTMEGSGKPSTKSSRARATISRMTSRKAGVMRRAKSSGSV